MLLTPLYQWNLECCNPLTIGMHREVRSMSPAPQASTNDCNLALLVQVFQIPDVWRDAHLVGAL